MIICGPPVWSQLPLTLFGHVVDTNTYRATVESMLLAMLMTMMTPINNNTTINTSKDIDNTQICGWYHGIGMRFFCDTDINLELGNLIASLDAWNNGWNINNQLQARVAGDGNFMWPHLHYQYDNESGSSCTAITAATTVNSSLQHQQKHQQPSHSNGNSGGLEQCWWDSPSMASLQLLTSSGSCDFAMLADMWLA